MTVEMKSEGTQIVETPDSHKEEPVNAIEDSVSVTEEEKQPANQESEAEETKSEEPTMELEEKAAEEEEPKSEEGSVSAKLLEKSSSFKEESNFLSDLKEIERKALAELKSKLEEAIQEKNLLNGEIESNVSLWRVPLLPSKNSDATNVVLLKFLRARDFKVKESFEMLQNTLQWRKEEKIDSLADEIGLGGDYESACYMDGYDREGHPVCYNMTSVFRDEEVYKKAFGSAEGRKRFLRWRVQVMEKGIQKLDFRPSGVPNLLQVTDLKNTVGVSKKELRDTVNKSLRIMQDNYPEFVSKNIFINVPFWYYAFHAVISPFFTQRTKSKFVFARPAQVTETLLKYIPAEAVPVRYGGFKREGDTEFLIEDTVASELMVKSGSMETIEISAREAGTTVLWDLSVLGWEVNYKEEFVPDDEGSYTIIVQKEKKMGPQEETIRNSFTNSEPGKIVLKIENKTFRKKKVLYRFKTKSS